MGIKQSPRGCTRTRNRRTDDHHVECAFCLVVLLLSGETNMSPTSTHVTICAAKLDDCGVNTLLRSMPLLSNSSGAAIDTVRFPTEAMADSNAKQRWPVRGTGVCVCYSGLQDRFGDPADRVLDNHVISILRPLSTLFMRELYVAFSTAGDAELAEGWRAVLATEHIAADRVLIERRPDGRLNTTHAQYVGIEHCGRLISSLAARRGQNFALGVRMRYDVLFSPDMQIGEWPIWNVSNMLASPVAALAKYFVANLTGWGLRLVGCPWQLPARRCMPQDVFFVIRNTPALGPVQSLFSGSHDRPRYFAASTANARRDQFERSMFHLPLSRGVPFDIIWLPDGECAWMLSKPRALFVHRCPRLRRMGLRPREATGNSVTSQSSQTTSSCTGRHHRHQSRGCH